MKRRNAPLPHVLRVIAWQSANVEKNGIKDIIRRESFSKKYLATFLRLIVTVSWFTDSKSIWRLSTLRQASHAHVFAENSTPVTG